VFPYVRETHNVSEESHYSLSGKEKTRASVVGGGGGN
jgi:hypothetical protein